MPPISIRNAASINNDLGFSALPFGFVSVPITTYMNTDWNDDISSGACSFVTLTKSGRDGDNDLYCDFWYVADFARTPLADALGIDYDTMAEADFNDVYNYADAYVSREFEGLSFIKDSFTPNSDLQMRNLQKIDLDYVQTYDTRALAYSKMMNKPLAEMQKRADCLL